MILHISRFLFLILPLVLFGGCHEEPPVTRQWSFSIRSNVGNDRASVWRAQFSQNGSYLVVNYIDEETAAIVVDSKTGEVLQRFQCRAAIPGNTDDEIVIGRDDGTLIEYSMKTGRSLRERKSPPEIAGICGMDALGRVYSIRWEENRYVLLSWLEPEDRPTRLFESRPRQMIDVVGCCKGGMVFISGAHVFVALATGNQPVTEIGQVVPYRAPLVSQRLSQTSFVTLSNKGAVEVDLEAMALQQLNLPVAKSGVLSQHGRVFSAVDWNAAERKCELTTYDLATLTNQKTSFAGAMPMHIVVSPNNELFTICDREGTISLWALQQGNALSEPN